MTAWTTRLGTFLTIVALALAPAVRVVCLAMCASPSGVARARVDAPRLDHATPAPPAPHAHHDSGAEASPAAAVADAATPAAGLERRCDVARRGGCGDASGVLPLPAGRAPVADAAIAPPLSRLATADLQARAHVTTPLIRVPPPGPPPASTPLRL